MTGWHLLVAYTVPTDAAALKQPLSRTIHKSRQLEAPFQKDPAGGQVPVRASRKRYTPHTIGNPQEIPIIWEKLDSIYPCISQPPHQNLFLTASILPYQGHAASSMLRMVMHSNRGRASENEHCTQPVQGQAKQRRPALAETKSSPEAFKAMPGQACSTCDSETRKRPWDGFIPTFLNRPMPRTGQERRIKSWTRTRKRACPVYSC